MRNTMTRPMRWAESQPVWEYHLYGEDGGDTTSVRPSVWPSRMKHVNSCRNRRHKLAHMQTRRLVCGSALPDTGGLYLPLLSLFITSSVLNAFTVIYTKVGGGAAAISDITVLTSDLLLL